MITTDPPRFRVPEFRAMTDAHFRPDSPRDTEPRPTSVRWSRRHFLASTGLAAAALGTPGTATGHVGGSGSIRRAGRRGRARNVIFLVADGMSTGTLTLADMAHRRRREMPSRWVRLWSEPGVRRGLSMTHSANSLVTDSAAAGSAWGIGMKVDNGVVNITSDGREPTPLLVRAANEGLRTGLVTTTRITHATPAALACNVPRRNLEDGIARQMLERKIDVLLGGGARHFPDDLLEQHRPSLDLALDAPELRRAADGTGRLLGLFHPDHLPHELDREQRVPSLAEMTRIALRRLDRDTGDRDAGFVLQVEGGRVDHAAHANDAGALIADQLAFDAAIDAALDWVGDRDDTLVIITTDHGNANPGLTLYGAAGNDGFDRVLRAERSFEWLFARLTDPRDPERTLTELPDLVRTMTGGIDLSEPDLMWLRRRFADREICDGFRAADSTVSVLGAVLANHYGIAFVSPNHTADLVEVTALGPGSEQLEPVIDNVDLHRMMIDALALSATG